MKTLSIYTLTFQDGTTVDQQFEGFLQFKNETMTQMIVKAEFVKQWEEEDAVPVEVVNPVAVVEEVAMVEETPVEVVEKPVHKKFKRRQLKRNKNLYKELLAEDKAVKEFLSFDFKVGLNDEQKQMSLSDIEDCLQFIGIKDEDIGTNNTDESSELR